MITICEPNCPNRSPRCHAECAKFLEYHDKKRTEYGERAKEFEAKQMFNAYEWQNIKRVRGHKKRDKQSYPHRG